ncbi:MAG: DUF116 domain-containing protein [Acholeplasmataceae bacterium]|nr:DUF116 domain-containing protein [Acholeplasmataceae bacterium]
MVEIVFKPKKRVFITLASLVIIFAGVFAYLLWRVSSPGLAGINQYLPIVVGLFGILVIVAFLAGVFGIVLAILGVPVITLLHGWAWNAINLLFPLAVFLGRIFNIPRIKIEQSFIEVSNHLVRNQAIKVPASKILILTPHCIQLDTCPHKITRDIKNCRRCGRCSVGLLLDLADKYGVNMVVATGGTLARQFVKNIRPRAIIAVACERDLTSGIQDVFPLPVIGVLNERPFGPCFNTRVDISKVEDTIKYFLKNEDKNEQKN